MYCKIFMLWSFLLLSANVLHAYEIVAPEVPTPAEATAVRELRHYLEKVVDGDLYVDGVPAVFFVGDTARAREAGLEPERFEDEAWQIRSIGSDVFLVGGGRRGALYAAAHFLEDVLGIHWWDSFEEYVPAAAEIRLEALDLRGKPYFRQRNIYRCWGNLIPDRGRWAALNRVNCDGDQPISPEYGGMVTSGPPYFVHTAGLYFPAAEYFDSHPEYFAWNDGKRAATQLCLSNPEVERLAWEKLQGYIAEGEQNAAAAGQPPPLIYDFSANDGFGACHCPECAEKIARYGSEIAPYLEFVNALGRKLTEYRPGLYVSTLAYLFTEAPPAGLRAEANVIVRLCDTKTNLALPLTDPGNREFLHNLEAWARIADNLGIWDYSINYAMHPLPFAYELTLGENLRAFAANNVRFVFFEHEVPESADMHTMTCWLEAKLAENPDADAAALIRQFTDLYYGAAAPEIREYRQLLLDSVRETGAGIGWFTPAYQAGHLNLDTVTAAEALFDRAEEKTAGDPVLLRRVRRARMNLDITAALRARQLGAEHFARGGAEENFPLDMAAMADRALASRVENIRMIIPPEGHAHYIRIAEGESQAAKLIPLRSAPPAYFAGRDIAYEFTAETAVYYKGGIRGDDEAESGSAAWFDIPDDPGIYALPELCAVYVPSEHAVPVSRSIGAADIPGPGYHWYKIGDMVPKLGAYVFFLNDWTIQFPLDRPASESDGETEYELWASIKFAGPAFPHSRPGETNAAALERLVLLKK